MQYQKMTGAFNIKNAFVRAWHVGTPLGTMIAYTLSNPAGACRFLRKQRNKQMKNYQCRKCGLVVQKESTPGQQGCQNAPYHSWVTLGDVGPVTYQCRKCGITVESKGQPGTQGCQSASYHSWAKL